MTLPWSEVVAWKELTNLWACCAFSRNERDSLTLGELVHKRMNKRLNYGCTSRFKVKNVDIVENVLDEDWMMETIVRQGWTLVLVFEVGQGDGSCRERRLSSGMRKCILMSGDDGLTSYLISPRHEGIQCAKTWHSWSKYVRNKKFIGVQHLGEILK